MILQAAYMLLTAIWPIGDIDSFMKVTGPKTDIWLVKTVGALLIPVGITLLSLLNKPDKQTAFFLGAGTAVSFFVIDTYYTLNDVISNIYLADAVLQMIFFVWWVLFYVFIKPSK